MEEQLVDFWQQLESVFVTHFCHLCLRQSHILLCKTLNFGCEEPDSLQKNCLLCNVLWSKNHQIERKIRRNLSYVTIRYVVSKSVRI